MILRMKNTISVISLFLSLSALIVSLYYNIFRSEKIVYVESIKLFSNYKGATRAKAEYEKKIALWKANVDTLAIEFNNAVNKYEKEKSRMSTRERKLSEELLASKRQQVENYRAAVSENAKKEDDLMTAKINNEIGDFLKKYGESHGYDFILGSNYFGNITFAKKEKNITDEVLIQLNKEFQDPRK